MSLFGFLKSRGTAPVARERLQILLAHERISVGSSNLLAILRDELLATIARHIEFDPEKLTVKLERAGSVSTLEIDVEVPSDKIASELSPPRPGPDVGGLSIISSSGSNSLPRAAVAHELTTPAASNWKDGEPQGRHSPRAEPIAFPMRNRRPRHRARKSRRSFVS